MITLLMKLGLAEKTAKLVAYIAIPLLILGAFYLALDAYGDARYGKGKSDTDAAWKAASDKTVAKAATEGRKADQMAGARAIEYAAKVEEEKEKIDAAIEDGSSPLDVLFGPSPQ
jgi:hypothetical protein